MYYPELFTSNDDVEFSMTWMNGNKSEQALGIGFLRETDKDSARSVGYSGDHFRYNFTGSGVNVISSLNPNDVIKLQYKNGVCYLYKNDTLIGSATESIYDFYFGFYTNNGRSQTVKDIKIKPL